MWMASSSVGGAPYRAAGCLDKDGVIAGRVRRSGVDSRASATCWAAMVVCTNLYAAGGLAWLLEAPSVDQKDIGDHALRYEMLIALYTPTDQGQERPQGSQVCRAQVSHGASISSPELGVPAVADPRQTFHTHSNRIPEP